MNGRTATLDPDALAALEEQRGFLTRSLADLEREHDAGDLDDDDYRSLCDDYERRLESVRSAIEDGKAAFSSVAADRNPRRTALIAVAVVVFALVCGFTVAQLAGRRTAGSGVSGETRLGAREQLSQCLSQLIQGNNPTPQVLQCYDQVLKSDPANVEARTYKAGLSVMVNHDVSAVNELISVATSDPSYPDVHAFLAIAFSQLGRPDTALAELKKLDTLNPTPLMRDLVADLRTTLESTTTTTTTP